MTNRWLIAVALVAAGGPALAQTQDRTPPDVRLEQRLNERVPLDLPFHDEQGRVVRLGDCVGGKPTVLVLAYYKCPMLCTRVLNNLLDCLRGIDDLTVGGQINVVTVSFDPREDKNPALVAAKKASYLSEYGRPGAEAGWHFLTGEQPSIDALTQAVGFHYREVPDVDRPDDPRRKQFDHPSGIMVLTPDGRLSRYFYGLDYPPRDVRLGLKESSEGQISKTLAEEVLLRCFMSYDPATGRYTPTVMRAVRVGAVLTVLALGAFILVSLRRERRFANMKRKISTP
jgi:protein SCO1/2